MTARERINRRKRWVLFPLLLGIGVLIAAVAVGSKPGRGDFVFLAVPAFALMSLVLLLAQFFWLRCPWCRGNLAPLAFQRLGGLPKGVKFCPYCGHELDDQLPDEEPIFEDEPF